MTRSVEIIYEERRCYSVHGKVVVNNVDGQ